MLQMQFYNYKLIRDAGLQQNVTLYFSRKKILKHCKRQKAKQKFNDNKPRPDAY